MFHNQDLQCLFDKPLIHELNPSLSPSSYIFPLSPPNFDDGGGGSFHHDLLTSLPVPPAEMLLSNPSPTEQSPINPESSSSSGRKRGLRKDRHSKIFTAQGPRDRRMRLSLDVARNFFDLQDMLGFDKPSKTVQWLLTTSNSAIKGLSVTSRPKDSAFIKSSTTVLENISTTMSDDKGKSVAAMSNKMITKRMTAPVSRKTALDPGVARESRILARAWARERTTAKKRIQCGPLENNEQPNNILTSSSIPIQTIEDRAGWHELKSSLELVAEVEEGHCPSPKHYQGSALDERILYEAPKFGAIGLDQVLDCNQNFISNYMLQEQCGKNLVGHIEDRGVTDVQLHARALWEFYSHNLFP